MKYEWYRVPDDSDQFIVYAEYESEENFKECRSSAVVQKIGRELKPLVEGVPEFRHFNATIFENSGR